MIRRRELNRVRTDKLEQMIVNYEFRGQHDAAAAIRRLAEEIGAPVDEKEISQRIEAYKRIDTLEN